MELTRRRFTTLMGGAVALAAGVAAWARTAPPVRFLQAIRGNTFPGRVRPLDESNIRTPGRWLG